MGSGVFGREARGGNRVGGGYLAKHIENTTLKLDDQVSRKFRIGKEEERLHGS